ncbi:UNVERIFIED_CONTAM: Flavonol 4'-sulfotransferase [Sesamum radiatum]|uniref:Sulfotransferase n=1 Tax=Sesamum radiatum TaxID=300843 RepID=A0AAW2VA53_SESRA
MERSRWYSVVEKDNPWEVEAAVDQFCRGVVPFGPYYDHVLAYRQESLNLPEKVYFLTYEELKENPRFHVRKLGEFLGCPFDQSENGEEKIDEIVKMCSFEILSSQQVNKSNEVPSVFPLPYSAFFRKDEVGDHENYLEDNMIAKIWASAHPIKAQGPLNYGLPNHFHNIRPTTSS